MSDCGHKIWDKDTYLADGYCPICMMKEIEELRKEYDDMERLKDAEIERLQGALDITTQRLIDTQNETAYGKQKAEIERLTAAFNELTDALNKVLPGNTPSEWMKDIECLQMERDALKEHYPVWQQKEINRLRAALEQIANDPGGHPDSGAPLRDIAREALDKGEEK